MSDREEFEKWKKEHSMNLEITIRDSNGDYQYLETRRDWYVWQNAIAMRQSEIDALKGKLNSCVDTGCRIASGKERLKNEIAALKAEIIKWQDETQACALCLADAHAENTALKAENERLREAAERATPPAQEDEPIFHTNNVCLISEWMDEVVVRREKDSQHNIPLYTRPDNSALRKAAAEVWDLFDSGHANNELMQCAMLKLSAALEGN